MSIPWWIAFECKPKDPMSLFHHPFFLVVFNLSLKICICSSKHVLYILYFICDLVRLLLRMETLSQIAFSSVVLWQNLEFVALVIFFLNSTCLGFFSVHFYFFRHRRFFSLLCQFRGLYVANLLN